MHLLEAVLLEVVEANPATILVTATTIFLTPLIAADITVVSLIAARITVTVLTADIAAVMGAVLVVAVMGAVLTVADFRQANFLLNNFAFPELNCLC